MLKRGGAWKEVDWQVALDFVARELKRIAERARRGHDRRARDASPDASKSCILLAKLARGLGSGNVDFRLRQSDFCGRRHDGPGRRGWA